MAGMFRKAVKHDAKLRLALCGPSGSGKTFSALKLATCLGGPIAYVDTEHGSASKYADQFSFDVIEPDVFDPRDLIDMIHAASEGGYKVFVVDSLSHYWMGKGGELEMVDAAARKIQGNSFAAWKHVTPIHNQLIDTLIAAPIHIIACIRTKTEWVIEKDDRGKSMPRKVGLAPIMRDGIEFEFDVCGDLDQDNNLTITKSRCPALQGQVINRPGKGMAETLRAWLSGAPPAQRPQAQQQQPAEATVGEIQRQAQQVDTSGAPVGTQQASDAVRDRKLAEARAQQQQAKQQQAPAPQQQQNPDKLPTDFKVIMARFAEMKGIVGEERYYAILAEVGGPQCKHANQLGAMSNFQIAYEMLLAIARSGGEGVAAA